MNIEEKLRKEFEGEDGSFLLIARCELRWDKEAFRILTALMYDIAVEYSKSKDIPQWIAHGFWFCDTWIRSWTSHENFPQPEKQYYDDSLEIINDLAYLLFNGESPYEDDTLEKLAKG